jgi:hypothetical protein
MCFWSCYILFCNSAISGLQEECPLLNESTTNLLTKLQHDNQLLQYQIQKLMSEKDAAARLVEQIQDRECGTGTRFVNEGILHVHPSLQAGIHERPINLEISGFHATVINSQQRTSDSRNRDWGEVRNVAKQSPGVSAGRVQVDENSEYVTPIKYEEETAVKPPSDGKKESVTSEQSLEYGIVTNPKNPLTAVNMQHVESNSIYDFTDHVDIVAFEQFMAHDNFAKFSGELNDEGNVDKSYTLGNKNKGVADFPLVMKDDKNSEGSSVKDDGVAQPSDQVKDKGFVFPRKDGNVVLEHTATTHSSGGDTIVEVNRNVDSLQPEVIEETYDWKENNLEIIKSTLKLLQAQYDDVAPTDTGRILPSSIALATEVEQSLVHLQDTITECEVQKTDLCAQLRKTVEVSVSKLKETAEGLVDDIDEQLYKLVSTIVRKLKKFKGKLQDKWCHLTDKYDHDSDAVYNWLHSSVLLECKESGKQTRRKFNQFSAKELHKSNDKFVRRTSDENEKGTHVPDVLKSYNANEEYDFKNVDSSTASAVDQKNNIPVRDFHVNNKQRPNKFVVNHDSLNEQHFKTNTPVTFPEEAGKSTGQEQYMSESQKSFDNGGTFKRHFSRKEKSEHDNQRKRIPQSKTCWQARNGKTVCHKCKSNERHLHSENLQRQHCEDNHWYEEKNLKHQFNDKKKREYKKHETENSWRNGNKQQKQSVILEHRASWILDDTNTPKQNNVSGDWILKMASDRAERRKLEHRSDWVFDRADARKLKREKQHLTDNWYFERARGREYCRYYSHSDWCKTGTYSGPNYDWLHRRDHENEYYEDGRLRHGPRGSNKFIPRSFAATGKFIKDSFTYFKNKMNYHTHR